MSANGEGCRLEGLEGKQTYSRRDNFQEKEEMKKGVAHVVAPVKSPASNHSCVNYLRSVCCCQAGPKEVVVIR